VKNEKTLVIGIGNPWRGDDDAGLEVARRLREWQPAHLDIVESDGDLTQLLELWRLYSRVVLVDALHSGAEAGSIVSFQAERTPLPAERWRFSTHGLGLCEAVEMARTLGQLPDRLQVFAIEGKDFSTGARISPEVVQACTSLAERILQECPEAD